MHIPLEDSRQIKCQVQMKLPNQSSIMTRGLQHSHSSKVVRNKQRSKLFLHSWQDVNSLVVAHLPEQPKKLQPHMSVLEVSWHQCDSRRDMTADLQMTHLKWKSATSRWNRHWHALRGCELHFCRELHALQHAQAVQHTQWWRCRQKKISQAQGMTSLVILEAS